jgi:predicted amidohydrolase
VATLNNWKIKPLICYDLRFPVWSRNAIKQNENGSSYDYDVLIYVANWPEKRNHAWKSLLVARAIENQCYVIGVNRIGIDGTGITYSGDSVIINPLGEIISNVSPSLDTIETITLSMDELTTYRKSFPVLLDADNFKLL